MVYFRDSKAFKAGEWSLHDVKHAYPETEIELWGFNVIKVKANGKVIQRGFLFHNGDPEEYIKKLEELMMAHNRGIFISPTDQTIVSGFTSGYGSEISGSTGRVFNEKSDSDTERIFHLQCSDDNGLTPKVQVKISLLIDDSWTDWVEIEPETATPKEITIEAYGKSWWVKNDGVKFQFKKSGNGRVTYTKGQWI